LRYGPVGLAEGAEPGDSDGLGESDGEGLDEGVSDGLGDGLGGGSGMLSQSGQIVEPNRPIRRMAPVPSVFITQRSRFPERAEVKRMVVPSADHVG
jgi:hypothetical protein